MEQRDGQGEVARGATMLLLFSMAVAIVAIALGMGLYISPWFFLLFLGLLLLPVAMYASAMWFARRSQSAPEA